MSVLWKQKVEVSQELQSETRMASPAASQEMRSVSLCFCSYFDWSFVKLTETLGVPKSVMGFLHVERAYTEWYPLQMSED